MRKNISASIPVKLEYQCSKCGAQNCLYDKVQSSVTFEGFSDEDDCIAHVQQLTEEKLRRFASRMPFNRFVDAELSCKCSSCKHTEPWARLRYSRFMFIYSYMSASAVFIFSIFVSTTPWMIVPLILSIVAMAWTFLHKPIHRKMMKKQINHLRFTSIPTVYYPVNGDWEEIVPQTQLENDCWLCHECGEIIKNHFDTCVYCGTSQAWSREQFKKASFNRQV